MESVSNIVEVVSAPWKSGKRAQKRVLSSSILSFVEPASHDLNWVISSIELEEMLV